MSIEEKVSTLTTIPEESLNKVHSMVMAVHSNDILNAIKREDECIEVDTIEGKVLLQCKDDGVVFKFVPSEEFSQMVKTTITEKRSMLVEMATLKLKRSLSQTYKDIL